MRTVQRHWVCVWMMLASWVQHAEEGLVDDELPVMKPRQGARLVIVGAQFG